MQDLANRVGKFQFELTVLLANHLEKAASILGSLTEQEAGHILIQGLFQQMKQGLETEEVEPMVPLDEMVAYAGTYIDGLLHKVVRIRGYQAGTGEEDEVKSMQLLTKTVFYMRGVEEKKAK